MGYRIGIDCGSKTIKVVVIDENGTLVHSLYRRHRSDIKTTLAEALHDLAWRHGDLEGTVGVTGSAGIGVAELLGLPFVQEVIATTHAVQATYPQADAIIELGGEDAKVVYLTGGLEQRMNATCAGGTGGFIDTIAFMLGTSSRNMSSLALGANRIYPIASRCAVFAQTDVRPLLNAGARTSDLAASALEAVVRQTLGGLACGRPIQGTVVFLGGPLEHIPDLVHRFRLALGLSHKEGIKPPDAHLFTARGAALVAAEEAERARTADAGSESGGAGADGVGAGSRTSSSGGIVGSGPEAAEAAGAGAAGTAGATGAASPAPAVHSLSELEERVRHAANPENDLVRLPPLFSSEEDLRAFRERHQGARMERVRLFDCTGPLYLGIDAGSTAVKLAVLDEQGRLAYSDYHATESDALKTASNMLADLFVALPRATNGTPYAYFAHATVTGYGEDLLRAGLGIDSGVVETLAHVRAAQQFRPGLTFLLDIGGQDMKAIWVRDGRVVNAVLNEACSSGCGSFIEGTAYSLRSTPYRFAAAALEAKEPVDLGTKCTVFMTSRVRHAQKIGVETADIAAGIAYSVVKNALFRIIGMNQLDSLGPQVVVQGGAFMSDAVLRAFELVSGVEATRPDTAHLMGAIGAALTARLRAVAEREQGGEARSSLVSAQELAALDPKRTTARCPGCENACALSLVEFAGGKQFVSGNRCDRAYACLGAPALASKASRPPNVVALQQKLLARFGDVHAEGGRGGVSVGLPCTLSAFEQKPFWHALLATLGFSVRVADDRRAETSGAAREGLGTIPSESVCFPAKLAHTRLYDLAREGVDAVFMPRYVRGSHCPVNSQYAAALADSAPLVREGGCMLASPEFAVMKPAALATREDDRAALLACVNEIAARGNAPAVDEDELDRALAAGMAAQQGFERTVQEGNERAIAWARRTGRRAAALAGRPYHADPSVLHGIDRALADVGFAVLSPLRLEDAVLASEGATAKDAGGMAAEAAGKTEAAPAAAPRNASGTTPERPRPDGDGADKTDTAKEADATDGSADAAWRPGKRLARLARLVAERPWLELVCLQSFGCGFDALSIAQARALLEAAGRPFTTLKIDDIADTAHIRIRLRTLAETLEAEPTAGAGEGAEKDIETDRGRANAQCAGTSAPPMPAAAGAGSGMGSPANTAACAGAGAARPLLGRVEQADLDTAQQAVPNDACFVVSALAGRAIRLMQEDPSLEALEVPAVCERCLLDALPGIVQRAAGRMPQVTWTSPWPQPAAGAAAPTQPTQAEPRRSGATGTPQGDAPQPQPAMEPSGRADGAAGRPRIGIVGNALLCFDPFMNDHLIDFIERQGCSVVLPDPALLFTNDVRYLEQMDRFAEQGVRHVIYLQSFGCLKGHVQARGALHELAQRHPDMPVTVIDYDPEASALNRENRVRLALAAAKAASAS